MSKIVDYYDDDDNEEVESSQVFEFIMLKSISQEINILLRHRSSSNRPMISFPFLV